MKKRNLNWALAALAAMALIFAAGCAENGADGAVTNYSGATYNLTLDEAIWLAGAEDTESSYLHTPSATATAYIGMVTLDFADRGTGVTFTVDYASCTQKTGDHADKGGWTAYASSCGDIHYQAVVGDAYYHETANGVVVFLPWDSTNSALALYFAAGTDSTSGAATLTLTSTDASSTASYKVAGGAPSSADALGNTIDNGSGSTNDSAAKDIFAVTSAFTGNTADTVLAAGASDGSVFTRQ